MFCFQSAIRGGLLLVAISTSHAMGVTLQVELPANTRVALLTKQEAEALSLAGDLTFVLENRSQTNVIAIAIRWRWRNAGGHVSTHDQVSESLLFSATPVIAPGEKLVVAPGRFGTGAHASGLSIEEGVAQFSGATEVTATVDTILFADGMQPGIDESGMVSMLRSRKATAFAMGTAIRDSLASGASPSEAIAAYEGGESDPRQWGPRFRRMALRANSRAALRDFCSKLIALPSVP